MPDDYPDDHPDDNPAATPLPGEKAPDSPSIRTWNRRVLGWGCAPAMTLGLVAGFLPGWGERIALAGTGIAILVAGPIAVYTWRLRRENQVRFDAARREAAERGQRVRVIQRADGGHDYELYAVERWEPDDWEISASDSGSGAGSRSDSGSAS